MVTEYRVDGARDPEARLSRTRRRRSTPSTTRRSTSTIARRASTAATRSRCSRRSCSSTRTTSAGRRTRCSAWPSSTTRSRPRSTWTPTRRTRRRSTRRARPTTPPPRVDYTPTINLYRRLLTEFPSYRFLDAAYYLLGFCLGEMGEEQQAKQALLALVCSNRFKPLDTPVPTPKPSPRRRAPQPTPATRTSTRSARRSGRSRSSSPRRGRASASSTSTTRTSCKFAIAAFRKVLTFKDSPYYDRALYKLAWSYYRDNRFPEAVREFDNLVKYADQRTAAGQKVGSDLRPEAVQYLGVSFAEPDWDGDTLPDPITGLAARDGASTRAARRNRTCARCSSASATSTSIRRSTRTRSPSTRRCSRSGRTTPTRRACRTASSTPTRRTATWSPPPRSARSWAARTPRAATGTSTTRTTPRRSRSRASWPRTRC